LPILEPVALLAVVGAERFKLDCGLAWRPSVNNLSAFGVQAERLRLPIVW